LNPKAIILVFLVGVFVTLTIFTSVNPRGLEKVVIKEKYYPHFGDGKAIGFETEKVISVSQTEEGSNCAMDFSNGETLEIDCDRYINYKIGETVYITYDKKEVIEIRRKR